jgi:hypothetical protein
LDSSTRHGAVLDTIEAIKEYINISNWFIRGVFYEW